MPEPIPEECKNAQVDIFKEQQSIKDLTEQSGNNDGILGKLLNTIEASQKSLYYSDLINDSFYQKNNQEIVKNYNIFVSDINDIIEEHKKEIVKDFSRKDIIDYQIENLNLEIKFITNIKNNALRDPSSLEQYQNWKLQNYASVLQTIEEYEAAFHEAIENGLILDRKMKASRELIAKLKSLCDKYFLASNNSGSSNDIGADIRDGYSRYIRMTTKLFR